MNDNNLVVTGPNGYSEAADFISRIGDVATYRVPAGGAWDAADTGTFTVTMTINAVRDQVDNDVPHGAVGTFDFSAPFAYLVGNDLHVDYLAAGNAVALLASGDDLEVTQGAQTLSFAIADFDSVILHGTSGATR